MLSSVEIVFVYKYYNINFRMDKECTKDIHETKLLREFLGLKKIYRIMFCAHTHTPNKTLSIALNIFFSLCPISLPIFIVFISSAHHLSSNFILNTPHSGTFFYYFPGYELAEVTRGSGKYLAKSKGQFSYYRTQFMRNIWAFATVKYKYILFKTLLLCEFQDNTTQVF